MRIARRVMIVATALACVASAGCDAPAPQKSRSLSAPSNGTAAAHSYLVRALDLMQAHTLNRGRLDWPSLRSAATTAARNSRTPAQDYPAIELTLRQLGVNGHSRLIPAGTSDSDGVGRINPMYTPVSASVAYLQLPSTTGWASPQAYLDAARAAMADGLRHHPCGWILDLRGNFGGNVWPMLLGVQPLLGTGTVAYFAPPAHALEPITLTETTASDAGHTQATVTPDAVLPSVTTPVAVLTNRQTASAAEAVTIAFHARPATRSFGMPTHGVPTANEMYPLSDGAVLNLTVAHEADRSRHVYPDRPIPPDSPVADGPSIASSSPVDPVIGAATEWLEIAHHCRN